MKTNKHPRAADFIIGSFECKDFSEIDYYNNLGRSQICRIANYLGILYKIDDSVADVIIYRCVDQIHQVRMKRPPAATDMWRTLQYVFDTPCEVYELPAFVWRKKANQWFSLGKNGDKWFLLPVLFPRLLELGRDMLLCQ